MNNTFVLIPTSTLAPSPTPATTGGQFRGNHSRRPYRNDNNKNGSTTNSNRFVLKIAIIESLVSISENKSQDFTKFQKSIHYHVLTTFKNSKDISKAILEFTDPRTELRKKMQSV